MKNLDVEHEKLVQQLKVIKQIMVDMRDEGLGGYDFEGLYVDNKLIPAILAVFIEDKS